jgi:hypothetical protein
MEIRVLTDLMMTKLLILILVCILIPMSLYAQSWHPELTWTIPRNIDSVQIRFIGDSLFIHNQFVMRSVEGEVIRYALFSNRYIIGRRIGESEFRISSIELYPITEAFVVDIHRPQVVCSLNFKARNIVLLSPENSFAVLRKHNCKSSTIECYELEELVPK